VYLGGYAFWENTSPSHPYPCRIRKATQKESATGMTREERESIANMGEK
jgi:hypothetical protein